MHGAVRFDEGLLCGVFRLRGVARDEIGGPEGDRLVTAHQLLVRDRIPVLRPLGELRVLRGDSPPARVASYPYTTPGAERFP